ncbi:MULTISPECIES: class I SAM-dependent RNA methyltransferase [Anaerolinea]|uniref:23S rRNA (Uracil-5-)-methyltransferase n=1 Tax=Anaerolinea thermophila (strain DSM 14523 / JCM 11388 / NBRC 100420 / UNI-1) TaxID=926569 RepID=E8MZG0_ANATU|nr:MULTISPECIES: class I SAM-dependent RNA methyltransferase [Anaerolinea]BAJ64508.1 putative 23S rRNA (uracil-5-)-methyltransferase [Anaerolinea thermophila UNI-1]
MSEFHLVDLTQMTYGGEAMGRLSDGRAVFVPFALAGERVLVQLTEEKRGFARATLMDVVQPSPARIRPRCPHFTQCGGCHYQHMDYDLQLTVKQSILTEQLQRIGGLTDPPIGLMVPSPRAWNYRNTVQFHLTPEGQLGFRATDDRTVIGIQECHLPEEPLLDLWKQIQAEPLPDLERLSLRLGADGEILLVLESLEDTPPAISVEELPVSVVHSGPAGSLVLAGDDHVIMEVLGRPFRVSAGSFFQVNTPMAEAMVKHVLSLLPAERLGTVLDVYCGVGLFSAFLAPRTQNLIGIESAPSACDDFAVNLDEFDNVSLYMGTAEQILPSLQVYPDLIVVDPPRAGLELAALDAILRMNAPTLIYISCDPATLARDTKRLIRGGYRLVQVTPFDLFPQTYHIESISLFQR